MYIENGITLEDPRSRKRYYFHTTHLRRLLTSTLRVIFHLFAEMQVSGAENLPSRGGVVLAANHLNIFDVFPMQFALPRPIFYMGKAELFKNPVMDGLLRNLGAFPVNRATRDEWALEHARKVLYEGQVLGIFPEGKRSGGRGLRPAKTGAARLAIQTGCPIVPMAVSGTEQVLSSPFRRAQVCIKLGMAILPTQFDSPLALTERVMLSIAHLLPADQRGVYARQVETVQGE